MSSLICYGPCYSCGGTSNIRIISMFGNNTKIQIYLYVFWVFFIEKYSTFQFGFVGEWNASLSDGTQADHMAAEINDSTRILHVLWLYKVRLSWYFSPQATGYSRIILGMGSANDRRRYIVTPPLIGWAHTHDDPIITDDTRNVLEVEMRQWEIEMWAEFGIASKMISWPLSVELFRGNIKLYIAISFISEHEMAQIGEVCF